MQLPSFPFEAIDWQKIEPVVYKGISGEALWRTVQWGVIRIRLVEYTAGYMADHWCSKGHIIFCVEGKLETELDDGRKFALQKGMMHTVGDDAGAHRSGSVNGCTLFIVD